MYAYSVKKSKVYKNKLQKQTEIQTSPKVIHRIYENPKIINSTTPLIDFDVCGSTYIVIYNRNIS